MDKDPYVKAVFKESKIYENIGLKNIEHVYQEHVLVFANLYFDP